MASPQLSLPIDEDKQSDTPAMRPAGCICWDENASLPCFPCYSRGFRTQNPEPPEADTDPSEYPAEDTDE
jgi:hypothetical protein